MKIVIDVYKDKIWGKNALTRSTMSILIKECFKRTNINPRIVFVNISFLDKGAMMYYNNKYRNINKETNVLSFANGVQRGVSIDAKKCNTVYLGEILLSFSKIQIEAREYNKSFSDRLMHMFVHSVLHLIGYDHVKNEEREIMEKLESDVLERFNINNIYES